MMSDKSRVIKRNHILNFITNDIRGNRQDGNDITNLSMFSKKEHLLKLVNEESKLCLTCFVSVIEFFINNLFLITNHSFAESSQTDLNAITEMNMWCDNLETNLISAAKDKQLNDFLVSLAPQISMKYTRILFLQIIKKIYKRMLLQGVPF